MPAGHDRFNADLIEEHLGPLRDQLGLSQENLMGFGRVNSTDYQEPFCMTVLGLKLSRRANAVSSLHGEVSRAMWWGLFPDKPEDAVPIGHITNGVHVPSWLAPQMCRLYDRHLGVGWQGKSGSSHTWEGIENVDDGELWETHLALKSRLLEFVRRRACEQAERRGEPRETLQKLSKVLSPDALTIGFARRFATYKRANLLLADMERLASMVNDPKRPVQFLFAGKAHPHDEPGKRVLQQIAQMMRDSQFANKFVFIEDYDINVGRYLVQGVDVWLNNPRRPLEASGTSGQKVVLNGGLEPLRAGRVVGRSLRRAQRLCHRQRQNPLQHGCARHPRRRRPLPGSARRTDSSLLSARPRRTAPGMDQAHEADHPHPWLALQRRSHGDGLHAEVLHSRGWRHVERNQASLLRAA